MPTRFYWRKKYREGRLGKVRSSNLLPVAVSEIPSNKSGQVRCVLCLVVLQGQRFLDCVDIRTRISLNKCR